MRMNWNETTIKYFVDASEYTGFHKKLAEFLKPYIKYNESFCDMGCGLGLIDIYLSKDLDYITCVDINENVINHLEKVIKEKEISNIKCMLKDYKVIDKKFDTILISFFGYEDIEYFSRQCNRLIAVVNDRCKTHIPIAKTGDDEFIQYSSKHLKELLDRKKFNYELKLLSMEFGQTFFDDNEIVQYAKAYDNGEEYDTIYSHIMKNIIKGDSISYYLPYEKNISIFIIDFNK